MIPILRHVSWAKRYVGRFRYDLSDSAFETPDLAALGLPSHFDYPATWGTHYVDLERAFARRIGVPRVVVTAGAGEGIAAVVAGLIEPGGEVLAEVPGYEPHRVVPEILGRAVRSFRRPLSPSEGSVAEAVASALRPETRMIVLSDLNNPTGLALPHDDARALEQLAEAHDLWLLGDESFRDVSERPAGTLASSHRRWVTLGSLSKPYGLGGLRLGWIAGSEKALESCANGVEALSSEPSLASVMLALDLVPHFEMLRDRARRRLADHRARWQALVNRLPAITSTASEGTVAWCRFEGEERGDAFAAFAAEHHALGVVPGSFFGDASGVRVAFGSAPDRFRASLAVFERAVTEFTAQQTQTREYA